MTYEKIMAKCLRAFLPVTAHPAASTTVMTVDELGATLAAQGVGPLYQAVTCPKCGTVQSARDLIRAGAGENFHQVTGVLGTSCIGRFTGAAAPRQAFDGQACNWSLDGLLQSHGFEVVEDGVPHPLFPPANPADAQANKARGDLLDSRIPGAPYGADDFFREARDLALTVDDLVPALARRPEFADCVADAA